MRVEGGYLLPAPQELTVPADRAVKDNRVIRLGRPAGELGCGWAAVAEEGFLPTVPVGAIERAPVPAEENPAADSCVVDFVSAKLAHAFML